MIQLLHEAIRKVFISINSKGDSSHHGNMVFQDSINDENVVIRHVGKPPTLLRSLKDSSQLYDSIPILAIDSSYRKALAKTNINLAFQIVKINVAHDTSKCTTSFCTGTVPLGIFGLIGYRASFESPEYLIFKSISLQLLLSLLVIALTIVSFYLFIGTLLHNNVCQILRTTSSAI